MMPELRWTLLIIGVLFIVILAWWERRRPHQASRQAPHIGGDSRPIVSGDPSWGPEAETANSRVAREPTLTLPEIRTDVRTRGAPRELPVVEIPGDLRDEIEQLEEKVATKAPVVEPLAEEPLDVDAFEEESFEEEPLEKPLAEDAIVPLVEPATTAQLESEVVLPPPVVHTDPPVVEWPPEDQRKLVSVRLVARPPERFQGRLVRQALAAEGFVLGALDIFHKPDAQNRAVLSAASLTKPGTFDLESMDTQRFTGLNLFAVLPGPRSAQRTFEDLLTTARTLNERLEGALQDDRGGPLTPTRIQILRDQLVHDTPPSDSGSESKRGQKS